MSKKPLVRGSECPSPSVKLGSAAGPPTPGKSHLWDNSHETQMRGCHGPSNATPKGPPKSCTRALHVIVHDATDPQFCKGLAKCQTVPIPGRYLCVPTCPNVYLSTGFYTFQQGTLTTKKTRWRETRRCCWDPRRCDTFPLNLCHSLCHLSPQHPTSISFFLFLSICLFDY